MKVKSVIAALAAVAAAVFGGAVHAAVVPIEQSLNLHRPPGNLVYNIATDGSLSTSTISYYELVIEPTWSASTRFTTFSTEPVGTNASYALYVDTDGGVEAGNTGALLGSWTVTDVPFNNVNPFHLAVLGAGQYILQLTTQQGQMSISTQISSVPLPGAIWLFGSALLGFLGITKHRKL